MLDIFSGRDLDGLFPGAVYVRQLPGLGIIIYGSQALGGAARVWDLSYQAGRVELFNLDPDPRQRHTLWCDDSDDGNDYDDNDHQGADGGHHGVVGLSVRH